MLTRTGSAEPAAVRSTAVPDLVYGGIIFFGAFLLFQIQPMIAKMILPWFGGAAAVWTACMLFFQALLLAGYLYADVWVRRISASLRVPVHLGLLLASLAMLPVVPPERWRAWGGEPVTGILLLLGATIGLPYLLLSSTSPLMQAVYARQSGAQAPYRFFALSNLASLLALLSYPVLVEPYLAARTQARLWSVMYAVYALGAAYIVLRSGRWVEAAGEEAGPESISVKDQVIWTGLPAIASALLLAGTNHITQNIVPAPFLWVLPLAAYLLSFILCFDRRQWYHPALFLRLSALALVGMAVVIRDPALTFNLPLVVSSVTAGVFVLSMFFHGEVALRKPHSAHLTRFYLLVALGGAVGGLAVSVAAPLLLPATVELSLVLIIAAAAILATGLRAGTLRLAAWAALTAVVIALAFGYFAALRERSIAMSRSFYGSLRVEEVAQDNGLVERRLVHGNVIHGSQLVDPLLRRMPTGYYAAGSGAELAIDATRREGHRVGIVGLGAGTLAALSRPGEVYRFYELDANVVELARRYFTYLSDSPARIDVVEGDARRSLEQEPPQNYDLLVVDAFSSDAIPAHLLSAEAVPVYLKHLRPEGMLAVHISNRVLDLEPLVGALAQAAGLHAKVVETTSDPRLNRAPSTYVLVARDPAVLERQPVARNARILRMRQGLSPWTDDYSNLWKLIK